MQKAFFAVMMFCGLAYPGHGRAQYTYKYKKEPALGIHFSLYDFNTAALVQQMGFFKALGDGTLTNIGQMQPALALSFVNGLTNHLDYFIRYSGSFVDYPFPNGPGYDDQYLLSTLDASVHVKLFSDRHLATPYLSGGIGTFTYKKIFGAYMPLGIGLQLNLFNEAYVLLDFQYHVAVSENAASTFYYSLGVAGNIGTSRKK